MSAAPLQLSISRISSIKNGDEDSQHNETMLTADGHHFFQDEDSHIDVPDDLVALEVDSEDLIRLNDTIEHPLSQKIALFKPATCQ